MHRIETIETLHLSIPFAEPLRTGIHTYETLQNIIVTIRSEGLSGVGYAFNFAPRQGSAVRSLAEDLAGTLIGKPVADIRRHWSDMWQRIGFIGPAGPPLMALSAIDTALWDLHARQCGLPLFKLLGAVRDEVEVYPTGGFLNAPVEAVVDQVHAFKQAGYRRCKVKVGRPDWRRDVDRIAQLVEAAGDDFEIMVDANQAWSLKTALEAGRAFEELGVVWFEEPIPARDYAAYGELARRLNVPVAAGESLFAAMEHWPLIEAGGCDVLMLNLMRCGGPTEFLQIGAMARTRAIDISAHTFTETSAHLAAAVTNATFSEYLPDWWDDLFEERGRISNGMYHLPDRPGLGLTVARDIVRKYSVD